jgi:hypothetical protein
MLNLKKTQIAVLNYSNFRILDECPWHSGHGLGGIRPFACASAGPEEFDGPLGFGG